ncbi:MAG: TolC family protein [Chitinophagaceae bacterium]
MKKYILIGIVSLASFTLNAQQNLWDLRKCVEYAQKNNVSVKQADIQVRLAKLETERARLAQHPTLNATSALGTQFGRSVDPTTNQFTTTQLLFNSINVNGGIQVFNWGALKMNREIASFNAQAAQTDVERITNDIALNVATFYLQVLATKQQIILSNAQIEQTQNQLKFTKIRVAAGALPELNIAEFEAQLARDSVALINSKANYDQAIIQLKAAINLPMTEPFDVTTPPVDQIPIEPLAELDPAGLYKLALTTQPLQKANELRIKSANKSILAARTLLYPTISAFGGLGTNFAGVQQEYIGIKGFRNTLNFVTVSGVDYVVKVPDLQFANRSFWEMWKGYGTQLSDNFRQNFGIQISVPIANNGNARLGIQRAELNFKNTQLTAQQSNIALEQAIYQAHTVAIASMKRFNASKRSVELAEISYNFANKRYENGVGTTLDVLTNQNNLNRAKTELLNAQFDYVFRMKLLEFYKGQGLKL